ncbi:cytochrome c-type biogenesis protein [Actinomarinicola tropica]|uniref:cytochrome c-type biogenesis protein n=1 Tax=Actinomarinicola tropica TaxID=2789776 RepID=UPI0018980347|nr:cytochrome c-type biogenesis protein [Actinomarinicola tropica]
MIRRRPLLAASWAALALVVVVALVVGTVGGDEPTAAERAFDLTGRFACPVCDGQAVRDSNAGAAIEIRAEITRRVQAGQSDDQVLRALSDSYGSQYVLTPAASGASSLVWVLPVVVGILAFAGLAYAFARWTPRPDVEVDAADRALVDQALRERHGER